jgi:hypothetical protein
MKEKNLISLGKITSLESVSPRYGENISPIVREKLENDTQKPVP